MKILSYLTSRIRLKKNFLINKAPSLLFILVFVSCSAALAQDVDVHSTPAAQAETEITPLKIGDKIPDELWQMYFPVVSANSDQAQYLSLGDFKDKLIILDFWATWCAPCITSLHKLDTLQEQFEDDLIVIPTSYEPESKVKPFLISKTINLSSLIEETELKKYFPHRSIPHQVWIKDKKVMAVTGSEYANAKNVERVLKEYEVKMFMKEEISFDNNLPLLIDGNGGDGKDLLYQSLITRRINVQTAGIKVSPNSYLAHNLSVEKLYRHAFFPVIGSDRNKMVWEISDSLFHKIMGTGLKKLGDYEKDKSYRSWLQNYFFSYNLTLPNELSLKEKLQIMQRDLNVFFKNYLNIEGEVQERNKDCIVFEKIHFNKTNNHHNILADSSKTKSYSIIQLFKAVSNFYPDLVIINEEVIDYNLRIPIVPDQLNDIGFLKDILNKNGFDFFQDKRKVKMLIIKSV